MTGMKPLRVMRVALMLAWAASACTDATGVAEATAVLPERTRLSVSEWAAAGLRGTFTNHGFVSVEVQGGSCDGRGTFIDRWTAAGWAALDFPPLAIMCPLMLVDNRVAPGGTLPVYAHGAPTDTGRYRLRIATSAGMAISGAIEVR